MTPKSDGGRMAHHYVYNSMACLRLPFFFIYIVFACAFCITVYTHYGINYLYIFEFDPNYKMTPDQLLKVGTLLFFIWSACFTIAIMEIKIVYVFPNF